MGEMFEYHQRQWILTFDGVAGSREYDFPIPKELFKFKTEIKTGNSPFTKTMRTTIDAVYESVYSNFKPSFKLKADTQQNIFQELAFT